MEVPCRGGCSPERERRQKRTNHASQQNRLAILNRRERRLQGRFFLDFGQPVFRQHSLPSKGMGLRHGRYCNNCCGYDSGRLEAALAALMTTSSIAGGGSASAIETSAPFNVTVLSKR